MAQAVSKSGPYRVKSLITQKCVFSNFKTKNVSHICLMTGSIVTTYPILCSSIGAQKCQHAFRGRYLFSWTTMIVQSLFL